jgi:hypothetical protein
MIKKELVEGIPQELADYLDFLNLTDTSRDRMVTKQRIDENLEGFAKAINVFLAYPDKLVELMSPEYFELYFSQILTLRVMSRHRQSYHTYTRGFSKSFLSALSRYIHTMLNPRHKAFIVAETKEQGATIAREKIIDDLWEKFPLLSNEMQKTRVAGKVIQPYVVGKDYAEFRFTHGGRIDVIGSGSSVRGGRRNSGIFEEVINHDQTAVNERIIPLVNAPRRMHNGKINPKEPQGSKIFVTTAGFQGTFAYEKLIESIAYSIIDPDRYMVLGGGYEIPLMHGLLDQDAVREMLSSPSFEQDSIDREYRSIWSGSPVGAAFTAKRIDQLRKVVRAEDANRAKDNEFYVVVADMAKDGSANTAVIVLKVQPRDHAFVYYTVNMFKIMTTDYELVSRKLKETVFDYDARMLVYDANGIGAAIRDWLNKEQVSSDTGSILPALGIINPPEKSKRDIARVTRDKTICYEIKAVGDQANAIHRVFFSKMGANNLRFLIKSAVAVEKFNEKESFRSLEPRQKKGMLEPYFIMDILEEEMKNLDVVDTVDNLGSNTLRIVRRNKKIQKDFFSALEYGVGAIHEYFEVPYYSEKRKKQFNPADYIMT